MDNIEATDVLLTMNDDTSPPHVAAASDHNDVTGIELDETGDLALVDIELDCVVDLDGGIRVADSPSVVGDDVWDTLRTKSHFSNLEKFVGSFLRRDAVDCEATLNVVKKAEVFARLFNSNHI